MNRPDFQPLAEIEIDEVKPDRRGFTLTGQGPDHAEYRLDVHIGMPLDARTRSVLGELLSHSDVTISRRPSEGSGGSLAAALRARRDRAHQR